MQTLFGFTCLGLLVVVFVLILLVHTLMDRLWHARNTLVDVAVDLEALAGTNLAYQHNIDEFIADAQILTEKLRFRAEVLDRPPSFEMRRWFWRRS